MNTFKGSNKKLTTDVATESFRNLFAFKEQKLDFYFVNHLYPISGNSIHTIPGLLNIYDVHSSI